MGVGSSKSTLGNAQAGRHGYAFARALFNCLPAPIGHKKSSFAIRFGKEDTEFLAPVAANEITIAHRGLKYLGDALQHLVPHTVSVLVLIDLK